MRTAIAFDVRNTRQSTRDSKPSKGISWKARRSIRRTVADETTRVFVPSRTDARIPAVFGLHLAVPALCQKALDIDLAEESRTTLMESYKRFRFPILHLA
jgi:hypothetical protein